jgi:hypothetical protein
VLWTAEVQGHLSHRINIDPSGDHLYVSDGWGVSYASLSLHSLRLTDGTEAAKVRTRHQQARTAVFRSETLIVAADTRIFELQRGSLNVVREWDKRIPRFADSLALEGDRLLMLNWLNPTGSIFDLGTGRVRRLDLGPGLDILAAGPPVLVFSKQTGTFWEVDLAKGAAGATMSTKSTSRAAVIAGGLLWTLDAPWKVESGVARPVASRRLRAFELATGKPILERPLEHEAVGLFSDETHDCIWVATITPGPSQLPTVLDRYGLDGRGPSDSVAAHPGVASIEACFGDRSVAIFATPSPHERRSTLICVSLPRASAS